MSDPSTAYHDLIDILRRRRSVRRFAPGKSVAREVLLKIAEAARWAPTGANSQCFDLLIIDDPAVRDRVLEIFLAQSNRLIDHVKGFPAVKKTYLANTVAIFMVLSDARWKAAFPVATSPEWADEYRANNERILLASIGAVVQNIQLAVTAAGLTSAWLSGGGEDTTNRDLAALLGYPDCMRASAPSRSACRRRTSRRATGGRCPRWCTGTATSPRNSGPTMVNYYVSDVRQFAMYRGVEDAAQWEDADKRLGPWRAMFTGG